MRFCPLLLAAYTAPLTLSIPATPFFFTNRVDHFSIDARTFQQRYYLNDTNFAGAGSPIICILGGEGAIAPSTGIFYPSIVELAARLGALVIEPEHRFYGESLPVAPFDTLTLELLTAPQALADAAAFITAMRGAYNCSGIDGAPRCPVITVGGSYPGFLSAMMRLRYPNVVDIAYAASAPMTFYSQQVDPFAYYRIVTESAERASAGCAAAVRQMLARALVGASKDALTAGLNLCSPLPDYLAAGDAALLAQEINMIVMFSFANLNMANYPPPATGLQAACELVAAEAGDADAFRALADFLTGYSARRWRAAALDGGSAPPAGAGGCYNLSAQLPSGVNATISSGDWSGVGSGDGGAAWDFETCSLLVEAIGVNNVTDMFLPRNFSIDWLVEHCSSRFGVVPAPRELVDLWGFDAARLPLLSSRIIFTNGENDGWSAGGYLTNLSETILAFNMPNGAHHSDLSHSWPSSSDTADVTEVRALVGDTIAAWLAAL